MPQMAGSISKCQIEEPGLHCRRFERTGTFNRAQVSVFTVLLPFNEAVAKQTNSPITSQSPSTQFAFEFFNSVRYTTSKLFAKSCIIGILYRPSKHRIAIRLVYGRQIQTTQRNSSPLILLQEPKAVRQSIKCGAVLPPKFKAINPFARSLPNQFPSRLLHQRFISSIYPGTVSPARNTEGSCKSDGPA